MQVDHDLKCLSAYLYIMSEWIEEAPILIMIDCNYACIHAYT